MAVTGNKQFKRAARIILVGAPGVGKGTQAERLMKRFPQLSAVSSGDLLRNAVRNRTDLGLEAESHMKHGSLVPDDMILKLILSELKAKSWIPPTSSVSDPSPALPSDSPSASFILDGFPRTSLQAARLDSLVPVNLVVSLVTPVNIILGRIADRWVHAPSGRVYNTGFNKPRIEGKDDQTGEPLTKREDDNEQTWRARLQKFNDTSNPLLEHYDRKGILWTVQGNSSDEISPKLFGEFEKRFC
ncbi:MAG: Adenylate kinase 2 [Ramalina farinacea]|uniref:GTP:AMP phosphotransferase, mitochondrial n=1 Tax=Ramalina farinacea TaxID=258253 RepID=A0AA43QNT8_9LECA|nr:Adenylate kinase 2 [Ramalina farinacea]